MQKDFERFWGELSDSLKVNIKYGLGNSYYPEGKDPVSFEELDKITDLRLSDNEEVRVVKYFKNLKNLFLSGINKLEDMSPVSQIKTLENLCLANTNITNLDFLIPLTGLKKLTIAVTNVKDISVLPKLPKLSILDISSTSIDSWEPLTRCKHLKELYANNCNRVDTTIISSLAKLNVLKIENIVFNDFKFLEPLSKLAYISFGGTKLGISYNINISKDYTPLKKLPMLKQIKCSVGIFEEVKDWFNRPIYYTISFRGVPEEEWVVEDKQQYTLTEYNRLLIERRKNKKKNH